MPMDLQTAAKVVRSALPLFGAHGLDGTSTRQIAQSAGTPMSAITYHFGGKDGLYLACAQHISDTMSALVGAVVVETDAASTDTASARAGLCRLFAVLVSAIVRDETAEFARFIVREQQEPTAAFDIIYGGIMGKLLGRMVQLMTVVARDRIDDTEIRVRVIALMGQVMAFRIARAATLRLTGWSDIGDDERAVIDRVVQAHLDAILERLEQEPKP